MLQIWFTWLYNFCVASVIRIHPALKSTEVLFVSSKRYPKSWVLWQTPYLYAQMALSVMTPFNYWLYVTNAPQPPAIKKKKKKKRTCLSHYELAKSEYKPLYSLSVSSRCLLQNPNPLPWGIFTYLRNTLYIKCMACLYYFQKKNIVLNY